jgi:hypothetical protein
MKKAFFLLMILLPLAFFFVSCNLDGETNSSPSIYVFKPFNQHGDTLDISISDDAYILDTISVGDTVSLKLYMTGYTNNLTSFYLKQSSDSAAKVVLPSKTSMDSIFVTGSDYKAGKFIMAGNSNNLFFPFKYVAKTANKESKLTFTITSDAKFELGSGSNVASFEIKTPIKAKK